MGKEDRRTPSQASLPAAAAASATASHCSCSEQIAQKSAHSVLRTRTWLLLGSATQQASPSIFRILQLRARRATSIELFFFPLHFADSQKKAAGAFCFFNLSSAWIFPSQLIERLQSASTSSLAKLVNTGPNRQTPPSFTSSLPPSLPPDFPGQLHRISHHPLSTSPSPQLQLASSAYYLPTYLPPLPRSAAQHQLLTSWLFPSLDPAQPSASQDHHGAGVAHQVPGAAAAQQPRHQPNVHHV